MRMVHAIQENVTESAQAVKQRIGRGPRGLTSRAGRAR